jgi:hypothetical protein
MTNDEVLMSEVTIAGTAGAGKSVLRLFQCVSGFAAHTGTDGRVDFWRSGQVAVRPTTQTEAVRLGRAWVAREPESRVFVSSVFNLIVPGTDDILDWLK